MIVEISRNESMGLGQDRTRDPWICSLTRISSHTLLTALRGPVEKE